MRLSSRDIDRFWSKVAISSGGECWPWIGGSRNSKGYGVFTVATGRSGGRKYISSRIACFLAFGAPSGGSPNALHSCDNPACCNPGHLRWGNQKANAADAIDRKRHRNPPKITDNPDWVKKLRQATPKGEKVHTAKATEDQIRKVWSLHLSGVMCSDISKIMNLPKTLISDACQGRSWRSIAGAPTLDELKKGGIRRGDYNQSGPTRRNI